MCNRVITMLPRIYMGAKTPGLPGGPAFDCYDECAMERESGVAPRYQYYDELAANRTYYVHRTYDVRLLEVVAARPAAPPALEDSGRGRRRCLL